MVNEVKQKPPRRYEKMRDSGVEWIGMVPEEWSIVRMKAVFRPVSIKNHPNEEVLSLYRDFGVLPKSARDDNHNATSDDTSTYKYVQKGNLVINKMKAWQGSLAISEYDGIVSPAYYVCEIRSSNVEKRYLHHLLRCSVYAQEFERLSTGMRVGQWDLGIDDFLRIPVLLPPLNTQKKIGNYLDEKCAHIDAIITDIKASIEEYKAWKASIIYEAVTKGLDPRAEMKDSGVKWIGEIPEEWYVCKTLFVLQMPITDGPHTTPELYAAGVPFVSAEAVSCGNGRIDFNHIRGYISEGFYQECCKKYIPQKDDIYMIKSGATTGKVAIVDVDTKFTIWSPLAAFRVNPKKVLPRYLFYFLQSPAYQKQVELGWSFGTQQNIGMRTLEKLKICVPPLSVQQEIIRYLDEKSKKLDAIIKEKTDLISDLESYKKSLIYEVVTGKRRVC